MSDEQEIKKEEKIEEAMEEYREFDEEFDEEHKNALSEKLKTLRDELKICRKEKGEYLAGWQRAKADFINARSDEAKAREEFRKFANTALFHDILRIADSLDMAVAHNAEEGTQRVQRQLQELLKHYAIVPIESVGKPFDPRLHEALEEIVVESEENNNMILEEAQKGYVMRDVVLRAAKVKVGHYQQRSEKSETPFESR